MTITVRLHEPNKEIREVTVRECDPIQVLQQEVKGDDKRFIMYNRNVLMTAFSFKFFGIKNGADIYVLRSPRNNSTANKQKKVIQNNTRRLHSSIKMPNGEVGTVDKSAACECIRLLDLLYIQDQIRPYPNRRFKLENTYEELSHTPKQETTVEAPKPTAPSTESLPIFWSNRKGRSMQPSLFV